MSRRYGPPHGPRRGPWFGHSGGRPPWWPADEQWPPVGEFPWHKVRRRFFTRVVLVVVVLFLLAVVVPLALLWWLLAAAGAQSAGKAIVGGVVILGLLVLAARGLRRVALPFGDLIEAAGRVESGDYSVRVKEPRHGPYELRSVARAFNAMTARLEADEKQRRTLLADVSHELRTPLAVLQGEIEAMIDGIHPADEDHLTASLEEIRVLGQLVEDLRTLTLAEAGTLTLHREPTDVAVLAQDSCSAFDGLARSAGVTLQVDMADDLPLVELDPLRIRQVLGNLVANALRYAPAGTAVRVVGERVDNSADERVAISVIDSGPGVSAELLPRLFERFAKSADSRGSGLGLAIARRLVEAHGGTIRAESPAGGAGTAAAEGAGTAIRFELPAYQVSRPR